MKTEAKGGLYYAYKRIKRWKLRWRYKHFGQFTIKNSYRKWTIFKKSWTKNLSLPNQYSKSFPVAVAPKPAPKPKPRPIIRGRPRIIGGRGRAQFLANWK